MMMARTATTTTARPSERGKKELNGRMNLEAVQLEDQSRGNYRASIIMYTKRCQNVEDKIMRHAALQQELIIKARKILYIKNHSIK